MLKQILKCALLTGSALMIVACQTTSHKASSVEVTDASKKYAGSSATTSGAGEPTTFTSKEEETTTTTAAGESSTQTAENDTCHGEQCYYFGFDSSELSKEDYTAIATQALYLSSHPTVHVRLEGNTDERGSREYNLALGERRALSVAELLQLQGASRSQIIIVSNGKEKPAIFEHDEHAYNKNRRVEMFYCEEGQNCAG